MRGRGRTACVDLAGIPQRRWQDQMRDKSIQCDFRDSHKVAEEAACEDAVAAYVDVAGTSLTEGDRTG